MWSAKWTWAPPPAGDPDLRSSPEADARSRPGQEPDRLPLLPALDDRQAEHARVERLRGFEVLDFEDELADTRDRDPRHRPTR